MECKVISNDREALFLSTQFEFFRDSSHASRGKRNSIVPSITEIEIQKSGTKTKIKHTHLSLLFLFLYLSFSIPLSLFLSFSTSLSLFLYLKWHEANELSNSCRPSKSDYRRFLCTQTLPATPCPHCVYRFSTLCIPATYFPWAVNIRP